MKIRCPACGHADTIPIMYGYPTYEAHLQAEKGELVIGGCVFEENSPATYCPACKTSFGVVFSFTMHEFRQIRYRYTDRRNLDRYFQLDFSPSNTTVTVIEIYEKKSGDFGQNEMSVVLGFEGYHDQLIKLHDFYFPDWKNEPILPDSRSWGLEVDWNDETTPISKRGNGLPPYHIKMVRLLGKFKEMGKIY